MGPWEYGAEVMDYPYGDPDQWQKQQDEEAQLQGIYMAKIGEMIESKYLKQSDVDDEVLVTVDKVGKGNIAKEGEEPEYKWMVRFKELKKPFILNSTNIKRMAKACESDETDDWAGKQVILYVDPDIEFAGNVVGGLRIRAKKGAKAAKSFEEEAGNLDDVPF
jgi:hypothetical protein